MKNTSEEIANCPLRRALHVLGGKWNLIIIKSLGKEELRFGEIKRRIPDVSEKVLIDKLKVLQDAGLLNRTDFKEVPPRVSYQLTPKGLEAFALCKKIEAFGEKM